jgi:hypothetical protein
VPLPILAVQSSHLPGRARRRRIGSFNSRTRTIYRHQTERAGSPLSYTLADMRAVVAQALSAGTCPYCAGAVTVANFSVDHHNPISRDGGFLHRQHFGLRPSLRQAYKGNLKNHEFLRLTAFLAEFPPEAGKNLFARLYAGGRIMRCE